MTDSLRPTPRPIAVLVYEEAERPIGLKIPEYDIEIYGDDLPELIERAEELLWQKREMDGQPPPEIAKLAVKSVTKKEFGPTCFDRRAEQEDWDGEE